MPSTIAISFEKYGKFLEKTLILPLLRYRRVDEEEEMSYSFYSPSDSSIIYEAFISALNIGNSTHFFLDPLVVLRLKILLQGNRYSNMLKGDLLKQFETILGEIQAATNNPRTTQVLPRGGWN